MAVLRCKMCGGTIEFENGDTIGICDSCGTKQTLPNSDEDKKIQLFERANRLRRNNDFDRAGGVYESIVNSFPEDAESYWGLLLCKYGIEYVEDPATGRKIPTCHRSSYNSIFEDSDFEMVMEYADPAARTVYRDEAKAIEEIRKSILEVAEKEEPYDVFICYKETDDITHERTLDSVMAQDIYERLTDKGYRVFFSRISLEGRLGMEYESYIFSALSSAKVMLVFGTTYDHFDAVWVKNEWRRYLKLMEKDKERRIIPCFKGIDAYDMPVEFQRLQGQDLGKVGSEQDLIRGIEKILKKDQPAAAPSISGAAIKSSESILKYALTELEMGQYDAASKMFAEVLQGDATVASAYFGQLLCQTKSKSVNEFVDKVIKQVFAPEKRDVKCKFDMGQIIKRSFAYEAHLDVISRILLCGIYVSIYTNYFKLAEKYGKTDCIAEYLESFHNSYISSRYSMYKKYYKGEDEWNLQKVFDNAVRNIVKEKSEYVKKLNEKLSEKYFDELFAALSGRVSAERNHIGEKIGQFVLTELKKNGYSFKMPQMSRVYLGKYTQEVGPNGYEVQPVAWNVIQQDGNKLLLVSEKVIDAVSYANGDNAAWGTSNVRKYVNSELLGKMFTESEKSWISPVCADGFNIDHLFCLSSQEIESFGLKNATFTAFAVEKIKSALGRANRVWFARGTGGSFASVYAEGDGSKCMSQQAKKKGGIRLAMWLETSAKI